MSHSKPLQTELEVLALLIFYNEGASQWEGKAFNEGVEGKIEVGNDLVECRDAENEIVHLLLCLMIDIYENFPLGRLVDGEVLRK